MRRNWSDPRYVAWRRAVYRRDGHRCRKCGARGRLQAHHIKRWANYPQLRFHVGNGIALCRRCHGLMGGNEVAFEALCLLLLLRKP
jgi:5-methylcytosine-specific restriction endonuclease McrA